MKVLEKGKADEAAEVKKIAAPSLCIVGERDPLAESVRIMDGMRSGMIALTASDGKTLAAWKKEGKLGWQLYDKSGKPSGKPGSADSPGSGAAGVVTKDGDFVLFR